MGLKVGDYVKVSKGAPFHPAYGVIVPTFRSSSYDYFVRLVGRSATHPICFDDEELEQIFPTELEKLLLFTEGA